MGFDFASTMLTAPHEIALVLPGPYGARHVRITKATTIAASIPFNSPLNSQSSRLCHSIDCGSCGLFEGLTSRADMSKARRRRPASRSASAANEKRQGPRLEHRARLDGL